MSDSVERRANPRNETLVLPSRGHSRDAGTRQVDYQELLSTEALGSPAGVVRIRADSDAEAGAGGLESVAAFFRPCQTRTPWPSAPQMSTTSRPVRSSSR